VLKKYNFTAGKKNIDILLKVTIRNKSDKLNPKYPNNPRKTTNIIPKIP
jgi:hypothetical protein